VGPGSGMNQKVLLLAAEADDSHRQSADDDHEGQAAVFAAVAAVSKSSPRTPTPTGAACWICLEEEPDKTGGRLMRNCACRGETAGYAHISCLADYADRRSSEIAWNEEASKKYECELPWRECPHCRQYYTGDVMIAMADMFVEKTKHLPVKDGRRLQALLMEANARLVERDASSALDLLQRALKAINSLTADPPEGMAVGEYGAWEVAIEANCYGVMSTVYKRLDNYDMSISSLQEARRCLDHFPDATDYGMWLEDYFHTQIYHGMKALDAAFKNPNDEVEVLERHLYCSQMGEDEASSIMAAIDLARALRKKKKYAESLEYLRDLVPTSTRVFGPDHPTTKGILQDIQDTRDIRDVGSCKQAIIVSKNKEVDGRKVAVLRLTKGDKYVCFHANDGTIQKCKISPKNLIFDRGTAVRCPSLTASGDLGRGEIGIIDSFDEEMEQYGVLFSKDGISFSPHPRMINKEDVVIAFDNVPLKIPLDKLAMM